MNFPEETVITGEVIEVGGDYVEIKPTGLLQTLPIAQFPGGTTIVSFEHIAKIIARKSKKRKHHYLDTSQVTSVQKVGQKEEKNTVKRNSYK